MARSPSSEELARERLRLALDGLSVGDAFGARMLDPGARVDRRELPRGLWRTTARTSGAVALAEVLLVKGEADPDALASALARRYRADPYRGWGDGAKRVLDAVARGLAWQIVSPMLFEGGSMGSGAAARSALIGAWYADDVEEATARAAAAAEITHAHAEGQAGAVAVAAASAMSWRLRSASHRLAGPRLLDTVLQLTPAGEVRDRLERASAIRLDRPVAYAAQVLGNGAEGLAPDTVPFALWCAARHLDGFVEGLWSVAGARGRTDALCAITGGVVAMSARGGVPDVWIGCREPLRFAVPETRALAQAWAS